MKLLAIAFDIDGTLYPNRTMYLRSIPFGLRNMRLMKVFRKVRKELRTIRPIEDFYATQARSVADALGKPYEETRSHIDKVIYGEWEQVLTSVPLYKGVREFIESLKSAGIRVGVMSDFPVHRKLEILGLSGLWDAEISAEETGYLKPAAEPFEVLSDRLGVTPEQTLYVGNSYHYDILGAGRAGMYTAHLESRTKQAAELVHTDPPHVRGDNIVPNIQFRDYLALQELVEPYLSV